MKGTYILIESDDENITKALVSQINGEHGQGVRLVGLYARPDDPCTCDLRTIQEQTYPPTMLIKELGWRVCTECMKPRSDRAWLRNQLPKEKILSPPTEEVGLPKRMKRTVAYYVSYISALPRPIEQFKER